MSDGGTLRPTAKFDPEELLGLITLTAAKERLRPTCEMPKLELTTLLHDPAMGRATPTPIGVITETTCAIERATVETPQLAKGSSGITAIPKEVLAAARAADAEEAAAAAAAAVTSLLEKKREPAPFATYLDTRRAQASRRFVVTLASCTAVAAAAIGLLSLV